MLLPLPVSYIIPVSFPMYLVAVKTMIHRRHDHSKIVYGEKKGFLLIIGIFGRYRPEVISYCQNQSLYQTVNCSRCIGIGIVSCPVDPFDRNAGFLMPCLVVSDTRSCMIFFPADEKRWTLDLIFALVINLYTRLSRPGCHPDHTYTHSPLVPVHHRSRSHLLLSQPLFLPVPSLSHGCFPPRSGRNPGCHNAHSLLMGRTHMAWCAG